MEIDYALLINLIISGIMLLFIVCSVIYGLIVGFKESLATGIYNLILVVGLLILTGLVTNSIINADLSGIGVNVDGAVSINQILINKISEQPDVASILSSNPDAINLIVKLPTMIMTPILFTIFYWLIKIVVFIVTLIVKLFVAIFTPKKKDANGKVIKKKKHRGYGALMGLATGIIAIFATFIPLFGIGDIATSLNSYKVDSSGTIVAQNSVSAEGEETQEEYTPLLQYVFKDGSINVTKIIDAYNGSVGITATKIIGIKQLGTVTFNTLSETKVNKVNIKLVDEVNNALNVYVDYSNTMNLYKKQSLTQEEMTQMINYLDNTVNGTFKSNIVKAVGNTIIPTIIDKVLNDPNFIIQLPEDIKKDEIKYALTRAILESIKTYDTPIINENLSKVIDILKVVNDNRILTPIYNTLKSGGKLNSNQVAELIINSNDDFSEKMANAITSIKLLQDIAPQAVDSVLDSMFKAMNLTYSTNNITKEDATNTIKNIIVNAIDGVKTLKLNTKLYLTKNTFGYIGNVIDSLKDEKVLSSSQYTDLLEYVKDKAKAIELPVRITKAVDNLSKVDNFNIELTKVGDAFDDFAFVYETLDTKNIDVTTLNLSAYGKLLDKLEKTTIFGGAITPIYNDALDLTKNAGLTDFENVIEVLKFDETKQVKWENELTSIKPLLDTIVEFKDLSFTDVKSALKIIDYCGKFDEVENNTNAPIYSSKMQALLTEIIKATKNIAASTTITDVCTNIETKLNTRTTETLENCVIKGIFSYAETLIPDASSFTDSNIQAMITEIKTNINKINNNEIEANLKDELNYMVDFADIVTDLQNFDSLTDERITEISNFLDTLNNSKIFGNSKTYIINSIIDTAIESITNDDLNIKGLLEDLKTNLPNVEISTMIKDLKNIQSKANNLTNIDISTMNTEDVASSLETVRNSQTFGDNFTNNIMKNLLNKASNDAQSSMLPDDKKTEIQNYCTENKSNLDNNAVTSTTYKTILDGLKNLFS